jgi:citrate lyase subunit beta/citryl-CoA lyase
MASSTDVSLTRVGEAGRSGKDIRSDLRVVLEPQSSGGLQLQLVSRVAPYYGDAIRSQALQVLGTLGVEHARVLIEDSGALPFVIAARLEAAARRAGLASGRRALPEPVAGLRPASAKDRLRRSRLYVPGSEPKYFLNAALYEPDAVIFDLEDAVHPAEKDAARLLVRNALRAVDCGSVERMVRINQLPLGFEDLREIIPESPDVIILPKIETAAQVQEVDRVIHEGVQNSGIKNPVWLLVTLESALGVENAFSIATASSRICALSIGLEDYTADMGVIKTAGGQESLYARTRLVNAAKAAGLQASDSVYADVGDLAGLERWAEQSYAFGFGGMGCVHPSQIPVVHRAFSPSQAELDKALRIVAAFQEAKEKGLGVVSLGSKMIDAPVVTRALKLVERARLMGLLPADPAAAKETNHE